MKRSLVRAGLATGFCLLTLNAGMGASRALRIPMTRANDKAATMVFCPETVPMEIQAVSHLPDGAGNWHTSSLSQTMYLCPGNGTNISGGYLHCGYMNNPGGCALGDGKPDIHVPIAMAGPGVSIFQALAGRQCTVRPDKKGFACTGP